MRPGDLAARFVTPEVVTFLAVGGTGYVVDVGGFNLLRSVPLFAAHDPSWAKIVAVALAMVVTYVGNRALTWRESTSPYRRREAVLFVLFNLVALGFSVVTLVVSHDLLGLTSALADNVSGNVVGLGLGTAFRFWTYRRFVFGTAPDPSHGSQVAGRWQAARSAHD